MVKSFSAQVDDIIRINNARIEALMRQSIQDVIDEAQTPVSKGGKMRVDTGFLRASGQISLNDMPTGPIRGRDRKPEETGELYQPVELQLEGVKAGATIFFGWTAAYAAVREAYDGFLSSAIQNWQTIVQRNTDKIRERIK